jgi:cell division protein FtsL
MAKSQNKKTTTHRFKAVEWIFMNLLFVCYCVLLCIFYISNQLSVENDLRRIEVLKREVKDAEWQYMALRKDVMYGSTPTQMAAKVKDIGIEMNDAVPQKLIVKAP